MFSCSEFSKVILKSENWCEMFVIKLSGIQSECVFRLSVDESIWKDLVQQDFTQIERGNY